MIRTVQIKQMRDAVHLSPRDERDVSAYLEKRKQKADAWRRGRLEQANNLYRSGMADLANVELLATRIEDQVRRSELSPQKARAELDTLHRAYRAGWETVESAGATVTEINAADPVEDWEAFVSRFPALAEKVPPPPACLLAGAPQS